MYFLMNGLKIYYSSIFIVLPYHEQASLVKNSYILHLSNIFIEIFFLKFCTQFHLLIKMNIQAFLDLYLHKDAFQHKNVTVSF